MNHPTPNSMTAIKAYRISANCQNCPVGHRDHRPTATSISCSRSSVSTAPSLRSSVDRGATGQVQIEAVNLLARHVAAPVLDAADLRQVDRAIRQSNPAGHAWCLRLAGGMFAALLNAHLAYSARKATSWQRVFPAAWGDSHALRR